MGHKISRKHLFNSICKNLQNEEIFSIERSVAVNGDSLDKIRLIPDSSISLILTDPPYHSTKKDNIANDKSFKTDEEFLNWMEMYFVFLEKRLKKY